MAPRNSGLEARALRLIMEPGDQGVLQSELWKMLSLSSREGSRLAQRFEEKGAVERRKVLHEGRWTYRLYSRRQPPRLETIEGNPCLSCDEIDRCFPGGLTSPIKCERMTEWIRVGVAGS